MCCWAFDGCAHTLQANTFCVVGLRGALPAQAVPRNLRMHSHISFVCNQLLFHLMFIRVSICYSVWSLEQSQHAPPDWLRQSSCLPPLLVSETETLEMPCMSGLIPLLLIYANAHPVSFTLHWHATITMLCAHSAPVDLLFSIDLLCFWLFLECVHLSVSVSIYWPPWR